jgi:prefoldin subunit 5
MTWNYKENNNTDNNMPAQQVNTVTISLDEYNEMIQSLDTLHNALEDNKVIIRDTPYSRAYMTCQTFTRDVALNKIAKRYYELESEYKALQRENNTLTKELYTIEKTWWFRLGKWLYNRK